MNYAFQRKFDKKSFKECVQSIMQSACFLGLNAFLVILFFCKFRHLFGRFYYTLCAYMPSFFGSLLAIYMERPSRRRALAFYVSNVASETLFRILSQRGYIVPFKHGQVVLFTMAITSLITLFESGKLQDPLIKLVFQLLLGRKCQAKSNKQMTAVIDDLPSCKTMQNADSEIGHDYEPINDETNGKEKTLRRLFVLCDQLWYTVKCYIPILNYQHSNCVHSVQISCVENALLNGLIKPFTLGYLSQLAWRIVPKLLAGRVNALRQMLTDPHQLFNSRNLSFGLFLSSFTTIYSTTRCLLSHSTNPNRDLHSLIASLVASSSISIFPSSSLALYLFWKSIEVCL